MTLPGSVSFWHIVYCRLIVRARGTCPNSSRPVCRASLRRDLYENEPMDPASSNHRTEQLSTGRTSCGQGGQRLMLPLVLSFFLQVSFISSEEIAFLTVRPHVGILTPIFHVRVPILLECYSKGLSRSQVHEYVVLNVHPVHAILCYSAMWY
jgi:hypothetical protein